MRRLITTTMMSLALLLALFAALAPSASAQSAWWHLLSGTRPSYLHKSGGIVVATAINIGDADTQECVPVAAGTGKYGNTECSEVAGVGGGEFEKEPVTVTDRLPSGLRAISASGVVVSYEARGTPIPCELQGKGTPLVVCTASGSVPPFGLIELRIGVLVETRVPSNEVDEREINEVSVSGGGAASASIRRVLDLSEEPVPFGLQDYELTPENEGGLVDTQAGSHPFQTTFTVTANQNVQEISGFGFPTASPAGMTRDVNVHFPPGLIGNPLPLVRCTLQQFTASQNKCPLGSVVGVAISTVNEPAYDGVITFADPVFNLEPQAGEPARFGFLPSGNENPIYINASVRAGSDYGIDSEVHDITQTISFLSNVVTIWGVPGSAVHDASRDGCLAGTKLEGYPPCQPLGQSSPPAFFELPTSCTGPLRSSVEVDSWEEPGKVLTYAPTQPLPALDGCNRLPFNPSITVEPDVKNASSASGLEVDVHVPQEESLSANGLGEADPRNITVALPAGVQINPSDAAGLEACSSNPNALPEKALGSPGDQIGYQGNAEPVLEPGVTLPSFSPQIPGGIDAKQLGEEELQPGVNFCSNASKIGTVKITTPVLKHPLEGAVYLAPQEANPFGSLVAMYIVAEDPESGVLVKLPGEVSLCQGAGEVIDGQTCQGLGQIVATFLNTPQAPFEDAVLHFFGGERSPLATPSHCGTYETTTSVVPWSRGVGSDSSGPPATPSSTFHITSGPNGGPCPGTPLPFNPAVTGGSLNLQAGEFTPLTVTMSRRDGEQNLKSIVAKLPPGLSGVLTGVELCPEPQANEGKCGPNSLVGETTVSVGVGGQPFTVSGGRFYLTGPYNGTSGCTVGESGCAPFGLTFEVPAKAGPFDLAKTVKNHPGCDCVIVRGKIELNSITSAITITSNPPGTPDSIPTELEGIPLEIQKVNGTTTRNDFQFNPTNCAKMALEGTVLLNEGGSDTLTTPFQVTNCAALKFEPKFSVSTSGKTSRADGASLTAKVTEPNVPQGTDADIAKVKVELPLQLPSRLTTLQKACTSAQFEADPAACPAASKIGMAVVHTPLIPVPLTGPAIFVSHGNESFPSLEMVLQGYGITIDLVGTTFISKSGITSTTFKAVPDQPFSSFELTLPQGPYSALAAGGNLCAGKLAMPTEFVGQNGAEIHESTKITVTGCAKVKAPTRAQKLAAALRACHRKPRGSRRAACEKAAREKYRAAKRGRRKRK